MKPTILLSVFVLIVLLCSCNTETQTKTETDSIQATRRTSESAVSDTAEETIIFSIFNYPRKRLCRADVEIFEVIAFVPFENAFHAAL